jgi:septal ring factor EnvC (AmiA/AmiB activator)
MLTEIKENESTFKLYRTKIEKQETELKLKEGRINHLEHQYSASDAKNQKLVAENVDLTSSLADLNSAHLMLIGKYEAASSDLCTVRADLNAATLIV